MVKAVGEDGADNHDSYRQNLSKAGRHRAQNLLVNDAVHLMNGMGVSSSLNDTLAVRWHPSSHCWGTVSHHTHKTCQVKGVLPHMLKTGIKNVLPSGGAMQWNNLENLFMNLKSSSDSVNENHQLSCVPHDVALIKSETGGIEF